MEGTGMAGVEMRVVRLEAEFTPEAFCRVTTWHRRCESRKDALARLEPIGKRDLAILLSDFGLCERRDRHTHDNAEVKLWPRH
jgi:hypothetical protein